MDFKSIIGEVFKNPFVRKLPSVTLVSSVVASGVHAALAAVDFALPGAGVVLASIGFRVGEALLPSLVDAAKRGIDHLGEWLEEKMQSEPSVNEAASTTLATNVKETAAVLHDLSTADAASIAKKMEAGLQSTGGAAAAIAKDYATAVTPGGDPGMLQKSMLAKIEAWASQSIEAKRGSLIENATQRIGKGSSGTQKVTAEDQSTIRGASQKIE